MTRSSFGDPLTSIAVIKQGEARSNFYDRRKTDDLFRPGAVRSVEYDSFLIRVPSLDVFRPINPNGISVFETILQPDVVREQCRRIASLGGKAGVKLLLTSVVSVALLVLGIAMLYAACGTLYLGPLGGNGSLAPLSSVLASASSVGSSSLASSGNFITGAVCLNILPRRSSAK